MGTERKNGAAGFLTVFIIFGTGFIAGVTTQRIGPPPSPYITENVPHVMEQTKRPVPIDWTKQKTRIELVEEECKGMPSGYHTFTDEEWKWIETNDDRYRPKTGRYSLAWELEQKEAKNQREIAEQEERNRRIAEWWKKKKGEK